MAFLKAQRNMYYRNVEFYFDGRNVRLWRVRSERCFRYSDRRSATTLFIKRWKWCLSLLNVHYAADVGEPECHVHVPWKLTYHLVMGIFLVGKRNNCGTVRQMATSSCKCVIYDGNKEPQNPGKPTSLSHNFECTYLNSSELFRDLPNR